MDTNAGAKKLNPLQLAALMALFFTAMGVAAISPAMAKLAAHFPEHNYALISTMPTLFIVPSTLWAGAVAGKRISYRTLSTVGIVLFLAGGLAPFFLPDSFTLLLVCRAVFGVGAGLRASLGNALVMRCYTGKKQAAMLGYGTLVTNLGGILFQMAGGALAELGWNYTFLAYLFGLLALALVLFQPEPQDSVPVPRGDAPVAGEGRLAWRRAVGIITVLMFLHHILSYPVLMNISLLFEAKGTGGATVAAAALSLYTVGGCVVGFLFGGLFHRLGRFTLTLGYLMSAAGAAILCFGSTSGVLTLGAVVMGMSSSLLNPSGYAIMARYIPPHKAPLCISIVTGVSNLGGFLCPLLLRGLTLLFGEYLFSNLYFFMAAGCLWAVVFVLADPLPRDVP